MQTKSQQPKLERYFLPYQIEWLNNTAPVKVWEKSRRIGATYVQSYEDVFDCISGKVKDVWFSSADESAAKEYIIYAAQWAKLFDKGASYLGAQVLDSAKDIKSFQISFSNGARINALSSNPKAFRSKGGKVVLDEFAHHKDAEELWKAARPAITWGFPLRILSTHNGKQSLFYQFIERISKGKLPWSVQRTDIFKAAEDGLVSKILNKKATRQEITDWIEQQHKDSFDELTWQEEYCCNPVDERSAFLSYTLIESCAQDFYEIPFTELAAEKQLYIGVDIARKKDLTVIWVLKKEGPLKTTIALRVLKNMQFSIQRDILFSYLRLPGVRRCCIDATGLGMQLAEEAVQKYGKYRVEAVTFTGKQKEEMAFSLLTQFEDKRIVIPATPEVREDLHSVKKIVTAAGNIRFDVARAETDAHADRFWALALANYADTDAAAPIIIKSAKKRAVTDLLKGF